MFKFKNYKYFLIVLFLASTVIADLGGSIRIFDYIVEITNENAIRFREAVANGTNYIGLKAPSSVTSSTTFTLPDGDGTNTQSLITNGSGGLSWSSIASSSSTGANYFTGGTFEGTIALATKYNDTSVYTDGTGGTSNNLTLSNNITTPLGGTADLSITKSGSDASHEGITLLSNTIDRKDGSTGARKLYISFEYDTDSAGYASGDICLKSYDVGASVILGVIPVSGLNDDGCLLKGESKILAYVNATTSTTSTIRVSLHVATTNASPYTIYIDDAKLSPDGTTSGYMASAPVDFTPSFANLSAGNGTVTAKWWRDGHFMKARVSVSFGSTTSISGAVTLTIPNSETIDSAFLVEGNTTRLGSGSALDAGTAHWNLVSKWESSTSISIRYIDGSSNQVSLSSTTPFTWTTTDELNFEVSIPISGWKTSTSLGTTEIGQTPITARYTAASTAAVPNSATIFDFGTKVYDKFNTVTTGSSWKFTAPKAAKYRIKALLHNTGAVITAFTIAVRKNGSNVSVVGTPQQVAASFTIPNYIESTIDLVQGDYIDITHDESINGAIYSVGTTGQYIEIEEVIDFTSSSIYGETKLTEVSSASTTYSITAGQWGDLGNLSLPVGTHDCIGMTTFYSSGATTTAEICTGMSSTSGNTAPGTEGDDYSCDTKNTTNQSRDNVIFHQFGVVVTEPTTYYMKAVATTSTTNLDAGYRLSCRKVQ